MSEVHVTLGYEPGIVRRKSPQARRISISEMPVAIPVDHNGWIWLFPDRSGQLNLCQVVHGESYFATQIGPNEKIKLHLANNKQLEIAL